MRTLAEFLVVAGLGNDHRAETTAKYHEDVACIPATASVAQGVVGIL
ncbi:hypothetical protein [Actinomadura sp. 6N118]